MACFAGPSFQDGSKPLGIAVCAGAEAERSVPNKAGSQRQGREQETPVDAGERNDRFHVRLLSDAGWWS
jgi:hypothetical protein